VVRMVFHGLHDRLRRVLPVQTSPHHICKLMS
jgi:hypothetical protein